MCFMHSKVADDLATRCQMHVRIFAMLVPWIIVAAPAVAQNAADSPRFSTFDAGAGIHKFVPGRWGVISIGVINPGEHDAEVLSAIHFGDEENLQYSRQLWVPPRSKRVSWVPVFVPETTSKDSGMTTVKSLLFSRESFGDVLIESPSGQKSHDGIIPVEHEPQITAIISNDDDNDEPREALAALRVARNLTMKISQLRNDTFPTRYEALDGLDQLVIAGDQIPDDPAGIIALRQWLHDGGRIWLMLDRVPPSTVSRLLGDSFRYRVLDRVGLTEVAFRSDEPGEDDDEGKVREFEEPVDMVRVVGEDLNTSFTVNGWPAAFWQPAGKGLVLFTTLGPRGWMRPREQEEFYKLSVFKRSANAATPQLERLAYKFLVPRHRTVLPTGQLQQVVSDQIGRRIVGRGSMAALLVTYCVALVGVGVLLSSGGRSVHLVWIGPVLAVVTAAIAAGLGYASRTETPPTVVESQFVEAAEGVDDLTVHGLLAIYNQRPSAVQLGASRGGIFVPDMKALGGETRRMVWTDLEKWHWEHLTLPAGVRTAESSMGIIPEEPIRATASWDASGVVGHLMASPFTSFGDAILTGPDHRNLAVQFGDSGEKEGEFTAGQSLASAQFIANNVLSDQQRLRQEVYRQLVRRDEQYQYPDRLMLLTWAESWDSGFQFDPDARRAGTALLAVPVQLAAPAPGTRVKVPSTFLSYQSVAIPGQKSMSAAFDKRRRVWIGPLTNGTSTMLRFEVPSQLLPLRIDRVYFSIKINAPSRDLEIFGLRGEQQIVLETQSSPVGEFVFEIDQADVLGLDGEGGLQLGVNVGDFQGKQTGLIQSEGWKIDDLWIEVEGEVLETKASGSTQ